MTTWRKSSRSGGSGGTDDCVEVADLAGNIGVRDSKNPGHGHLTLTTPRFAGLLSRIKDSHPDR